MGRQDGFSDLFNRGLPCRGIMTLLKLCSIVSRISRSSQHGELAQSLTRSYPRTQTLSHPGSQVCPRGMRGRRSRRVGRTNSLYILNQCDRLERKPRREPKVGGALAFSLILSITGSRTRKTLSSFLPHVYHERSIIETTGTKETDIFVTAQPLWRMRCW